ncbi:hypothetical protein [Amantichitinum ursilacus]|uniref:Uncharacterized protein n=1 Tax=Amantichitinum ursilacus TaxID=857265 RepID=A0A0N0XGJ7_9NEIS|nr:hypothetical protein [Amantichitinum ursilacus]KPC50162.1 hypothetical protein WG78_18195 [Amantichitinum ursilacus]
MSEPRTQPDQINAKPIYLVGLTVLALLVAAGLAVDVLLQHVGPASSGQDVQQAIKPPGPVLQTAGPDDLQRYQASKAAQLHGNGWVDRKAGIAHIDIDVAMQLLASAPVASGKGGRR